MGSSKLDPRVDPMSVPPKEGDASHKVERVVLPATSGALPRAARPLEDVVRDLPPEPSPVAPVVAPVDAPAAAPPIATAAPLAATAPPASLTPDPRLAGVDHLVNDNDWRGVAKELGGLQDAAKLPPALGLLAALAHHESDTGGQEAISLAVKSASALFGVTEESAVARVLARRLLRKNPVRLRDRKAPPARVSLLIVLATLLVGGTVGWLLSGGFVTVRQLLLR